MWRFFVFPLVVSLLIIAEAIVQLFCVCIIWLGLFSLLFKSSGFSTPPTFSEIYRSFQWANSTAVLPHWPYYLGLGLLLGVGLAAYETTRYRVGKTPRGLASFILNTFWLGLYLFLLTLPIACALQYVSLRFPYLNRPLDKTVEFYFTWAGVLIVFLAGICFLNSEQVFSPKTIVHRIRFGRFKSSES